MRRRERSKNRVKRKNQEVLLNSTALLAGSISPLVGTAALVDKSSSDGYLESARNAMNNKKAAGELVKDYVGFGGRSRGTLSGLRGLMDDLDIYAKESIENSAKSKASAKKKGMIAAGLALTSLAAGLGSRKVRSLRKENK